MKFKTGNSYGNDLTIEIVKRTEKTATIKTTFGEQRVKIRTHGEMEYISFKCWLVYASEEFDEQVSLENSLYNSYYL